VKRYLSFDNLPDRPKTRLASLSREVIVMRIRSLVLAGLLVGVVTPAVAQTRVSEGAQLRVVVKEQDQRLHTYEGTLAYAPTQYSLRVDDRSTDSDAAFDVPLTGVQRIESYQPLNRGRSARRGATVLGFIGGSLGVIAGPLVGKSTNDPYGPIMARTTAIGLGSGLLLGALGGAILADDGWQRHSVPSQWR
jgi:hypothetical protein